jgi:DNA-binding NarL/FixJ family response regulator
MAKDREMKSSIECGAKTRLYVVDDQPFVSDFVGRMAESSRDLEWVGEQRFPVPELPAIVRDAGADVVLMDISFGTQGPPDDEPKGIQAIRTLRRQLGSMLGIIALSGFEPYHEEALSAGADCWLNKSKDVPMDIWTRQLQDAIRNCKDHEYIAGLKLDAAALSALITIVRSNRAPQNILIPLSPNPFAFLYFLAQERRHKEENWIVKESSHQKNAPYQFARMELWTEICTSMNIKTASRWEIDTLSSAAFAINRRTCPDGRDVRTKLIITPGPGRRSRLHEYADPSTYHLNEFLESEKILLSKLPAISDI